MSKYFTILSNFHLFEITFEHPDDLIVMLQKFSSLRFHLVHNIYILIYIMIDCW